MSGMLGACGESADGGSTKDMSAERSQQLVNELAQRPNIEDALSFQQELEGDLTRRLKEEVGVPGSWTKTDEEAESPCGKPYSRQDDALEIHLPNQVNNATISEEKWPQALEVFAEVTGDRGFEDPEVIVDAPNDHKVRAVSKHGAEITFGTRKATALYSTTGCHLTQQAHPGPSPSPSPSPSSGR